MVRKVATSYDESRVVTADAGLVDTLLRLPRIGGCTAVYGCRLGDTVSLRDGTAVAYHQLPDWSRFATHGPGWGNSGDLQCSRLAVATKNKVRRMDFGDQFRWYDVPEQAIELADSCHEISRAVKSAMGYTDGCLDVRYNLATDQLAVNFHSEMDKTAAAELIHRLAGSLNRHVETVYGANNPEAPCVKLAAVDTAQLLRLKQATTPWLRNIAEAAHVVPGHLNWLPGGANPLTSMLAGGILGAAGGYGVGTLGEYLLPAEWTRGKLRRTATLLGAGLGAVPGAVIGAANLGVGHAFTDPRIQNHPDDPLARTAATNDVAEQRNTVQKVATFLQRNRLLKQAWGGDQTGLESARDFMTPSFDAGWATQQIWQQPLPPHTQAAMAGLTQGAAAIASRDTGQKTTLITPLDVARMTAGMGSGYMSGLLVGKALGGMFGAPPAVQQRLQQTGMLAGVLANLVPLAFGR